MMTLQKKSNPLTRSGVAGKYIKHLGVEEAAALIGLKPATLYAAANPDQEYVLPEIDYYVALDAACVELGYPAPFANWFMHKIGGSDQVVEDISDAMLSLHSKAANLTDRIRLSKSPDSQGGCTITRNEKADIFEAISEVVDVMNNIKATVNFSGGSVAIPNGGKVAAE